MKAAISGNFANHKRVPSRSVLQLIIEIPIEQTMDALNILGDPMPGKEISVAIARLAPSSSEECSLRQSSSAQGGDKPKSCAGQAKMLSADENFWAYLNQIDMSCDSSARAEQWIEVICGVKSCSEIIEGTWPGKEFKQLQAKYLSWKNSPPLESYEA